MDEMEEQGMDTKKSGQDRRNAETPPFSFRFDRRELRDALERRAKRNHRTLAGELNAIIEDALNAIVEDARAAE